MENKEAIDEYSLISEGLGAITVFGKKYTSTETIDVVILGDEMQLTPRQLLDTLGYERDMAATHAEVNRALRLLHIEGFITPPAVCILDSDSDQVTRDYLVGDAALIDICEKIDSQFSRLVAAFAHFSSGPFAIRDAKRAFGNMIDYGPEHGEAPDADSTDQIAVTEEEVEDMCGQYDASDTAWVHEDARGRVEIHMYMYYPRVVIRVGKGSSLAAEFVPEMEELHRFARFALGQECGSEEWFEKPHYADDVYARITDFGGDKTGVALSISDFLP